MVNGFSINFIIYLIPKKEGRMKKSIGTALVVLLGFAGFVFAQEKMDSAAAPEQKSIVQMDTVRLVKTEPFSYAALEMTGSYAQHGTAFQNLYQEAGKQGLPMNAAAFGVYWNSPQNTAEADLKWEIGLVVPDTQKVAAPLKLKKWEFPQSASITYQGGFDSPSLGKAYQALFDWMGKNGYHVAGPMMEKYLGMPMQNEKGEWVGKIEISMPVEKSK
jgi:effector-binding domain-containing protein